MAELKIEEENIVVEAEEEKLEKEKYDVGTKELEETLKQSVRKLRSNAFS